MNNHSFKDDYIIQSGEYYRIDTLIHYEDLKQYLNNPKLSLIELCDINGEKSELDSIIFNKPNHHITYLDGNDSATIHIADIRKIVLYNKIPFKEKAEGFLTQFGLFTLIGVVGGIPNKEGDEYKISAIRNGALIGSALGSLYFMKNHRQVGQLIFLNNEE